MTEHNDEPTPPNTVPDDVVDAIDQLSESDLRTVIDYAQERYEYLHPTVTEQIEAAPGEEILRVEERPEYTVVVKRQPCSQGCDDCPHGPYLYHVHEETHPDGSTALRWRYLGSVDEG